MTATQSKFVLVFCDILTDASYRHILNLIKADERLFNTSGTSTVTAPRNIAGPSAPQPQSRPIATIGMLFQNASFDDDDADDDLHLPE